MVEEFNQRILEAHNAHYINSLTGLIDVKPSATPNGNQIYHFYSTGKITHQKGAWAYQQRSEFTIKDDIVGAKKARFKFVLRDYDNNNNISYAILTQEECIMFRKEMETIVWCLSLKS